MTGIGGTSKGRRSSEKLADYLKRFEELGHIWREHERDSIVITDPAGPHRLADTQRNHRCEPVQPGGRPSAG